MTWNYRILRKPLSKNLDDGYTYAIHEVYYSKSGKPKWWAEDPETSMRIYHTGDSVKGAKSLKAYMNMMKQAFKRPVLEIKGNKLIDIIK